MSTKSKSIDKEIFFKALADRTRLRLLNLMRDGEVCVCFFVEILKTNQPKISRHLAYLRGRVLWERAGRDPGCITGSLSRLTPMPLRHCRT